MDGKMGAVAAPCHSTQPEGYRRKKKKKEILVYVTSLPDSSTWTAHCVANSHKPHSFVFEIIKYRALSFVITKI